jgi:TetR/AcrR family transcriptional regulator
MQTYCQTTPAQATNSREQQRAQSRELILGAAVGCFARLGFEAVSIANIASAAGVKKSLVQYHFSTKDKLWQSAIAHLWRQRDEQLPQYLGEDVSAEDEASIREIFRALATFNRSHPEWIALMFRESASPGPRLTWLIENYLRDDIQRGSEFIERAQRAGLLPKVSPLQLLHLVSGMLSYNLLVAPMTKQATGVDLASLEAIEQQVDILMQLLRPAQR